MPHFYELLYLLFCLLAMYRFIFLVVVVFQAFLNFYF